MKGSAGVSEYTSLVVEKITALSQSTDGAFNKAVDVIYGSLERGGVWHLFGTGHSSIVVQEAFHRAGGLIPVNPWLEEYIMPQAGPTRNGPMEKLSGLAQVIFDYYRPLEDEVLTIVSNSGINPTTVEMAEIAKKHNLKTIAITNLEHSKETKSRNPNGKKLFEVCDIVLDTGGVKGDAAVEIAKLDVPVGPLSTILNTYLLHALVISICERYSQSGKSAPVYLSANVPGGLERNRRLEVQYLSRIPRLR